MDQFAVPYKSFYIMELDGEKTVYVSNNMRRDYFFTEISKVFCFSDCTDEDITEIVWEGKHVHYTGWKPGELFVYVDDDGNTVWEGCFPEWDH